MVLGGIVAAVSGFIPWFDLTGTGGTESVAGTDLTMGLGVIGLGAVLALAGVLAWVRAPTTGGKAWSVTAIVIGAILVVAGGTSAFAPETAVTAFASGDLAETLGITEAQAEAALEQAFLTGQLSATAKLGTWVLLAGGVLGLVGGIMGVAFARRRAPAARPG